MDELPKNNTVKYDISLLNATGVTIETFKDVYIVLVRENVYQLFNSDKEFITIIRKGLEMAIIQKVIK